MSDPEHLLYSPEEVAERLSFKVRTVREWIRTGRLPAIRVGERGLLRVKAADLDAFVDAQPSAAASRAPKPIPPGRPPRKKPAAGADPKPKKGGTL